MPGDPLSAQSRGRQGTPAVVVWDQGFDATLSNVSRRFCERGTTLAGAEGEETSVIERRRGVKHLGQVEAKIYLEARQPSFRYSGVGASQPTHQHGEHLHGDLWTTL